MTIFMSTASSNRLLSGQFDPMATSAIALLVREFEWEYVTVRCQFMTGMLAYSAGQIIRIAYELHETVLLARSAMCFLAFATLNMLAFFNSHLVYYGSYTQLCRRFAVLTSAQMFSGRALPLLAMLCLAGASVFFVASLADSDKDGNVTYDELVSFLKRGIGYWAT